ncbi:hypothetical protein PROP_03144 [Propionicimonas sp. T2.31MG-18]|uniref:hypothetical protein n=1 Tax=Propionicimonas sp. T2.31MG-18 TaxID=3157620 RepID=UPI0035ED3F86
MTEWSPSTKHRVEVCFDGSTWENLSSPTNYVDLSAEPLRIEHGRDGEYGDVLSPGVLELVLINDDGRFSPDLPTSPYYPNVVADVGIRVSMLVDGTYEPRFWGTVQQWSVRVNDPGAHSAICLVTATGALGAFPDYTLWQASEQAVRSAATPPTHYWPRLDVDGTASSKFSDCDLVDNGVSADAGTLKLPLDEGDPHPLFTCSSGKRKLTATIPQMPDGYHWRVSIAISKPSASCNILEITDTFGPHYLSWDGTKLQYYGAGFDVTPGTSASFWPAVVSVRVWYSGGFEYTELRVIGSNGVPYSTSSSFSGYGLKKVVVCPTLSGGATFSAGHLIVDYNETTSWAPVLLAPRIPASVSAISQLSTWAGGPTITGSTVGECVLPLLEDRDAADVVAALAIGAGARLRDNHDGTLEWISFPTSGTPITLPAETVDPSIEWATSDAGWITDCTSTATDGTTYTATRADGRRVSYAIEGVNASRYRDRGMADWIVNTANTKARLSQAVYDITTLPTEADRATLASVRIGDRITITDLPAAILPDTLTLIVEGITDDITDDGWMVTFQTSPDVYSRLFILDDAAEVRRNYATIPNPTSTTGWITNNGTLYVSSYDATGGRRAGTGARKLTRAATSPSATIASVYAAGLSAWSVAQRVPVTAGEVWTVSSYSKASVAFTTSVAVLFFDASNVQVGSAMTGSSEAGSAGGWARPSVTVTVPSGATNMGISAQLVSTQSGVTSGGEAVWMTDALYEKVSSVDAYFDGSYSPDADDLIPSWTGTANASPSILTGGAGILDSSYIIAP